MTEKLYPSDICFSQNSISNTFSPALSNQLIGEVVDKIYDGDVNLLRNKILKNMMIGRWNKPGYENLWFTVNNRSLWVLKQLQLLGKLNDPITVTVDPRGIDKKRFSTKNKGVCVDVRFIPVGGTKSQPAAFWKYKGQSASNAIVGGGFKLLGGAMQFVDDDGYDSDEYYI